MNQPTGRENAPVPLRMSYGLPLMVCVVSVEGSAKKGEHGVRLLL